MNQLKLGNKKYIVVPQKEYELLQRKAALKIKEDDLLTLKEARAYSKTLIKKWIKNK